MKPLLIIAAASATLGLAACQKRDTPTQNQVDVAAVLAHQDRAATDPRP